MSVDTGLPPGIQVLHTIPKRPLCLPKFPYRSLNLVAKDTTFGELPVGASFFYKLISFYKTEKDTAISTSTAIEYLLEQQLPAREILFPEPGEVFNDKVVLTGVYGGLEGTSNAACFIYEERQCHAVHEATFSTDATNWIDYDGNSINAINVIRKTFVCLR